MEFEKYLIKNSGYIYDWVLPKLAIIQTGDR